MLRDSGDARKQIMKTKKVKQFEKQCMIKETGAFGVFVLKGTM